MRSNEPSTIKKLKEMAELGLHPDVPEGDGHHTDAPFTRIDRQLGELAWFMGDLFADLDKECLYTKLTPVEQWQRVARALRVHGLTIQDTPVIRLSNCHNKLLMVREAESIGEAAVRCGCDCEYCQETRELHWQTQAERRKESL